VFTYPQYQTFTTPPPVHELDEVELDDMDNVFFMSV